MTSPFNPGSTTMRDGHREPPLRIALYSHDTQGLGHIRRNLLIASALSRTGTNPTILLVSGLREAAAFSSPPGIDYFTIPSIGKDTEGQYYSRSLKISMGELVRMRETAIHAMLTSFAPNLFIADKVPTGVFDELKPSLQMMRDRGTSCVLGLREILDDPQSVRSEWSRGEYDASIRAYYDQIWVYGDRAVYDTAAEYGFASDIAAKVRHTGYLNVRDLPHLATNSSAASGLLESLKRKGDRVMLCVVGGGRDGAALAHAFMRAELPRNSVGVLVTGPLMAADDRLALQTAAKDDSRRHVLDFVTDPCPLLEHSDRVIAMGGYNTVCEVLAYRKPALIIPRVKPRTEQLIRAQRLCQRGAIDMLHPDDLSAHALSDWLKRDAVCAGGDSTIDFKGVSRLPQLLKDVLQSRRRGNEVASVA